MINNVDYIREASYIALLALTNQSKIGTMHSQAIPMFTMSESEINQFEKDFKNTNKYEFLFS